MLREKLGESAEPCMLLYADDMVIWAKTKEELKKKLEVVVTGMEKLGLQLSIEKTEIQSSREVGEGEELTVVTSKGEKRFKCKEQGKSIRYLGTWSTADLDESEGIKRLRMKVKERIERIGALRASEKTRIRLLKARVISVINYTASVQKIPKRDLEVWETMIYNMLTKSEMGKRRDLVYLPEEEGGMGMIDVREEYRINRIRGLTQLMESWRG